MCEGAFYADTGLKRFHLGPGHKILVYGASGAIGTAAVQLAKAYGAEVTAVVATKHLALATSLGADRAIDYTTEDFTQLGERFDVVFDAVGKTSFFRCRKLLKPEGIFMATDVGPWLQNLPLALWSAISRNNRLVIPLPARGSGRAFVEFLKGRMEAGQFRAVIDRKYPLDAIADAYRYVATKQKTGIVVINVASADDSEDLVVSRREHTNRNDQDAVALPIAGAGDALRPGDVDPVELDVKRRRGRIS